MKRRVNNNIREEGIWNKSHYNNREMRVSNHSILIYSNDTLLNAENEIQLDLWYRRRVFNFYKN
jgi:hypothetical protein